MSTWGEQFTSGDQGDLKKVFWDDCGMSRCPKCQGNTGMKQHSAGCRNNGDGYGTEVYTCEGGCGWTTSFAYDEGGECYYYETQGWKRGMEGMAVSDVLSWLESSGQGALCDRFENELVDGEMLCSWDASNFRLYVQMDDEELRVLHGKLLEKGMTPKWPPPK